MTLTLTPRLDVATIDVTLAAPGSATLARLSRIDRNGRTEWTGEMLTYRDGPELFRDVLCAREGAVEYIAEWSTGALETATASIEDPSALPRLYRLRWNAVYGYLTLWGRPVFTEHPAILDDVSAVDDISSIYQKGMGGAFMGVVNYAKREDGTLTVWCDSYAEARSVRDDWARHPAQYLRVPDVAGLDHALYITSAALGRDGLAWTATATYTRPPEAPALTGLEHDARTLGQHAGTLDGISRAHHILAEMG